MQCWKGKKFVPDGDECLGCGAKRSEAPPPRPPLTSERDNWEDVLEPKTELRYAEPEDDDDFEPEEAAVIWPAAPELSCPRCRSTQLTANKRGVSLKNALLGGAALGPAGLLGGLIGASKVSITCLQCGHSWVAGQRR